MLCRGPGSFELKMNPHLGKPLDHNLGIARAATTLLSSSRQVVEQGLGLLQIKRVETFSEPVINRGQ